MPDQIPEDHVEVEVIIKDDGTYEAVVTGHGKNTRCSHGFDEELLNEMMAGVGDATAFGHTDEYYEEKNKIVVTPPAQPAQPSPKQKEKKLDMGFGV